MTRTFAAICFAATLATLGLWHARSHAADVPSMRDDHMEMTLHASPAPGDAARGDAIVAAGRALLAKYARVEDAERDGYTKFLPNIPLPVEHYTSRRNAIQAALFGFDIAKPTSIIYRRRPGGLIATGVMYTAPNRFDAAQLDARVPLSLGTWHRHVDFCWPPAGEGTDPRFGIAGTIDTRAACEAAGGRFIPLVFSWMVHVWPLEHDPAKIWAVDADDEMGGHHHHHDGMVADQSSLPIPLGSLPAMSVSPGDSVRGAAIFAGNCASCHGAGGANGPDAPRLASSGLVAGQVAYMVRHPRAIDASSAMPDLGLSDRDLADVAAYVATLNPPR